MISLYSSDAATRSAEPVRDRIGDFRPDIAIILGSGLGGLVDHFENEVRVPFADVPGFPEATVIGHAGALVAGRLGGKNVIALAGRFHMYEGHSADLAGFPVRVMHVLGARTLFTSNAAGAVRPDFEPGDLMIINDHLNLSFSNPLTGPVQDGDERFPDMSAAYDPQLRSSLLDCGRKLGIPLREGVYACLSGPSFETPAEVRMLRTLGADAVGMSTVPEVIVARAIGMRVVGMSCITNAASGTSEFPVLHKDVLDVTERSASRFQSLVTAFVTELPRAE